MDEQRAIAIYGLTREQCALLAAAIPESYQLCPKPDVIGLIVTEAVCCIVNAGAMEQADIRLLQSYYAEVGAYASERIIWIGEPVPPGPLSKVFSCCSSFLDMLLSLDTLLPAAWERYTQQSLRFSEYSLLPARAIADHLEQEIACALHRAYGDTPAPAIVQRVRQEWAALQEVSGAADLAAAYELSLWLKRNRHPYCFLTGDTPSGLIPYLLGITDVNPLPPHLHCPKCHRLIWKPEYKDGFDIPPAVCEADSCTMLGDGHDLVWQQYCGYGLVPVYEFHLPADMRESILPWLETHWLQRVKPEGAGMRSDGPVYQRGGLAFCFDLDRSSISPAFYTRPITADCRSGLIRTAEALHPHLCGDGSPSRSSLADAVATLALGRFNPGLLQSRLPDRISCREDIFFYLKAHGFVEKDAFRGMSRVRKGRGFPVVTEEMQTAPDRWVLRQCENVNYLPSRSSLLSELFFRLKAEQD